MTLLAITDGLECFGGYFRLFGLSEKRRINMFSWNSNKLWKFSWGDKLQSYWCFGETAWGDQYAYRLDDKSGIDTTEIYFIECVTMVPEKIDDSFETFLAREILRNASNPYDEILVDVRAKLGDLPLDKHIVYVPSPLLGGAEDPSNVQKMDAIASMIVNGDLYSQLATLPQEQVIKELHPYVDENGRNRLKVVWL